MRNSRLVLSVLVTSLIAGLYMPRGAQASGSSAKASMPLTEVELKRAAFSREALENSWFLPGQVIRSEPSSDAGVLARLESVSALPVSAQEGRWLLVTFKGRKGWIDSEWTIPWNRRQATRSMKRNLAERPSRLDRKRLKIAKEIMGLDEPRRLFGAMEVYTNISDPEFLDFLERAASMTRSAYFARYGRVPSGELSESIVLFRKRGEYLDYLAEAGRAELRSTMGHAGAGMLVLFAGKRSPTAVASTLMHEIGHHLNRRSLARSLPSWLEEGLAADIGSLWVEKKPEDWIADIQISWREMSVTYLYRRQLKGEMPGIGALSKLDYKTFTGSEYSGLAFSHAGSFIRYMASDDALSEGFRRFLFRIAKAEYQGTMGLLINTVEVDVGALDEMFRAWVKTEGARIKSEAGPGKGKSRVGEAETDGEAAADSSLSPSRSFP